ncbi:MAG: bifunctional phosphopantothenoylcysteine decarboxylase/phosphopantothenate--cysteine ligase CoaBC [Candidatus Dadabacteria bacterium]|nr:MAG: bifunctional phosphopantothenoylcysteine decarboxylase/phosphopantothenate--cysteine ligase CoaBC [Candidatus Dadabacteria bacterium]
MLRGKEILLGVTGGIAAYKSVYLCRELTVRGANVHVVMTKNAMNFVTPLTFQTISGNPVTHRMFELFRGPEIGHVALADRAHALVVAPATANILGKVANGLADDFLSTMIMATRVPVLFAPAMNVVMWESPAVQENVRRLRDRGYAFVGPVEGELACGVEGKGKMADPLRIVEALEGVLTPKDLRGETVLVTAGPTIEPMDPVRFISNHSSGKMGYALARAAVRRGARVILVTGPTSLPDPLDAEVVRVTTAREMRDAVIARAEEATVTLMAAAVCDWRPAAAASQKIKKRSGAPPSLELEPNPDILRELGARKRPDQILIGFAAETSSLEESAKAKLEEKRLDAIVANDVTAPGAGFHVDTNEVVIFTASGERIGVPRMPKDRVADRILGLVAKMRRGTQKPGWEPQAERPEFWKEG